MLRGWLELEVPTETAPGTPSRQSYLICSYLVLAVVLLWAAEAKVLQPGAPTACRPRCRPPPSCRPRISRCRPPRPGRCRRCLSSSEQVRRRNSNRAQRRRAPHRPSSGPYCQALRVRLTAGRRPTGLTAPGATRLTAPGGADLPAPGAARLTAPDSSTSPSSPRPCNRPYFVGIALKATCTVGMLPVG